jgi:hypothetical protein
MAISEVCAVSKVSCSVSDGHYTESGNCSVSNKEKGRRALGTSVSHRMIREMHQQNACLTS